MRKIILLALAGLMNCVVAGTASGTSLDANLFTEFYAYKIKLPEVESHFRSLQGFRLGVRDAFTPGLSFFIRGRMASDLSKKFSSDPDFRVFGAYLEYIQRDKFSLRAGRQFVFAGLGGFTLDGGRLDLGYKDILAFTGYAGTTPGPSLFNYDEVNSWKESNAYGARLKFTGLKRVNIGVSFLQRNFKENLDSQTAGFDISCFSPAFNASARADYDLFFNRVKLLTLRPAIRFAGGHSVNIEYSYKRPSFALSNVFSVFNNEPFQQIRVAPRVKINTKLYALGSLGYTKFKDDDNIRASIGAAYSGQTAGAYLSDGYGGRSLGLFGSLTREFGKRLQLYLNGDMFRYKLDSDLEDTTPSLAAALGGYYNIMENLNSRAEVQLLSNRDYKYDTRLYIKLDYGFIKSKGHAKLEGGSSR